MERPRTDRTAVLLVVNDEGEVQVDDEDAGQRDECLSYAAITDERREQREREEEVSLVHPRQDGIADETDGRCAEEDDTDVVVVAPEPDVRHPEHERRPDDEEDQSGKHSLADSRERKLRVECRRTHEHRHDPGSDKSFGSMA